MLLLSFLATIGSAVKGFAIQIAGSDGTNARLFRLDADGHAQVDVLTGGGTVGGALEATQGDVRTAVQLIDDGIATVGAAVPARGMQATGTDGANARVLRTDADGHVQVDVLSGGGTVGGALEATQGDVRTAVQLIDDAIATVAAAVPAKGMIAAVSDGTNARLLRGNTTGYLQPIAKYTDSTTILNAVTADNNAPAAAGDGVAFQADTRDAYLEIWCIDEELGVSNVDINIYLYQPDSALWYLLPGGSLVDLQLQTNNRWGVLIANARLCGTRVYAEVDNYVAGATTIKVSAKMTEVT